MNVEMAAQTQTASVAPQRTAWMDGVTLSQVDPALGIQSLTLSLTGTVAASVRVSNLDLAPATFSGVTAGLVTLSRPDGSAWLTAAPVASMGGTLPAASGAGASAVGFSGQGSDRSSVGYQPAQTSSADAALLVGTGQVSLPVKASARVHATGPGNMEATFTTLAGADVSLAAATSPGGDGGTGGAIVTPGFPTGYPGPVPAAGSRTTSQTYAAADALIGATTALTFDGFNPSQGVLESVTISVRADAYSRTLLENLDPVAGAATVGDAATLTISGPDGSALLSSTAGYSTTRQLGAFDGTDDFSGVSAAAIFGSATTSNAPVTTQAILGAGLAAFESGPVTLDVARAGVTTLDAPGSLHIQTSLLAGAEVTVAYNYLPPDLQYTDTTTGRSGALLGDAYTGPVAGLQKQYIWSSAHGVAIQASAPNVFLHGGAGDDALAVSGGSNVLDGGTGSNFLTGGTGADGGRDTFFLDARGVGTTWSTLSNFHAGDTATVFGFHAGLSTMPFTGQDGAAGHTGLTLHAETAGAGTGVNASLTFAGVTQAVADAHWTLSTGTLGAGTAGATDYLLIQWDH